MNDILKNIKDGVKNYEPKKINNDVLNKIKQQKVINVPKINLLQVPKNIDALSTVSSTGNQSTAASEFGSESIITNRRPNNEPTIEQYPGKPTGTISKPARLFNHPDQNATIKNNDYRIRTPTNQIRTHLLRKPAYKKVQYEPVRDSEVCYDNQDKPYMFKCESNSTTRKFNVLYAREYTVSNALQCLSTSFKDVTGVQEFDYPWSSDGKKIFFFKNEKNFIEFVEQEEALHNTFKGLYSELKKYKPYRQQEISSFDLIYKILYKIMTKVLIIDVKDNHTTKLMRNSLEKIDDYIGQYQNTMVDLFFMILEDEQLLNLIVNKTEFSFVSTALDGSLEKLCTEPREEFHKPICRKLLPKRKMHPTVIDIYNRRFN
jgi:hypothetical protein